MAMQFDVREPELAGDVTTLSLPQCRAVEGVGRNAATKSGLGATPEKLPSAPAHIRAGGRMMDSHGRTILDLRISTQSVLFFDNF